MFQLSAGLINPSDEDVRSLKLKLFNTSVREKDCETIRSIAFNLTKERIGSIWTISYQKSIGRVPADNVYSGVRCIATRNQDIGDGLANNP